ncbi:ABC transporter ATP-binding protein [Candidatus Saccharibacteria bacterium]|nr:ABC transporter ATP-binding protein [Candidatus Saccharibacteria bacterium]
MFREQHEYIKRYFKLANLNPWLFGINFFTAVIYKGTMVARKFVAALIIKGLTDQNPEETWRYILIYTIIYVVHKVALFLNYRAYSWNVSDSYRTLQTKVFKKIVSVGPDFTRTINKGRLMNTINNDILEIGEMNDEISEYITTFFQIGAIFIIVIIYNVPAAIILAISTTIYTIIRTRADRRYNHYWWYAQSQNDRYSDFLGQVLSGLQEVKTFNLLPPLRRRLDKIQSTYNRNYFAQRRQNTIRDNDVKAIYYIFHAALFAFLTLMMAMGHMELDILVLIISYHEAIIGYTKDLTDATIEIRLTNAAMRRVSAILNYKPGEKLEFGNLTLDHLEGEITFKNVSLSLNHHQILKNISFKVKPREFVAIVGYPGSGKTKIFDLILRLNKPTKGKVLLDDIDVKEFSRDIYTSNVAVANQVPFIFNTSIRKNLNFVDTNIKHQIEACKTAGIHDFIETLPQGYNTILRENATNVSGGQRQMISIARTILTDAEVLLLDDVTTALDPDTAKLVPRLINKLKDDRTIIMITKKPELMKSADRIIVLDHGRISDIGTHEKLLERSKLYRSLQALKSEMELKV